MDRGWRRGGFCLCDFHGLAHAFRATRSGPEGRKILAHRVSRGIRLALKSSPAPAGAKDMGTMRGAWIVEKGHEFTRAAKGRSSRVAHTSRSLRCMRLFLRSGNGCRNVTEVEWRHAPAEALLGREPPSLSDTVPAHTPRHGRKKMPQLMAIDLFGCSVNA